MTERRYMANIRMRLSIWTRNSGQSARRVEDLVNTRQSAGLTKSGYMQGDHAKNHTHESGHFVKGRTGVEAYRTRILIF